MLRAMPRSGAEARNRLERAALELYAEHGYNGTTTAEIAARAGVTERTFFRHFADKREVLFHVQTRLDAALGRALAEVPPELPPISAVLEAFRRMAASIEEDPELAAARNRIISSTPALQERELAKAAGMAALVADALRSRGLQAARASLLARVSVTALSHAVQAWTTNPSAVLDDFIVGAFTDLQELTQPEIR